MWFNSDLKNAGAFFIPVMSIVRPLLNIALT
jgi:hypothetical protein